MERARGFAGSTTGILPDLAYVYAVAGKQSKSRASPTIPPGTFAVLIVNCNPR